MCRIKQWVDVIINIITQPVAIRRFQLEKRNSRETKQNCQIFITPEKWAIVQGLSYLLTPFEQGTRLLSGEKYPTFVSALPILRYIKKCISRIDMFSFNDDVA
jgi:hypothetical protein